MAKTMKDVNAIKRDLLRHKPPKPAHAPDRVLSNTEIILTLAPVSSRIKGRGISAGALAAILAEHQIDIKAATLKRYLIGMQSKPEGNAARSGTDRAVDDWPIKSQIRNERWVRHCPLTRGMTKYSRWGKKMPDMQVYVSKSSSSEREC